MHTGAVCGVCVRGCKEYRLSVVVTNRLVLFFVLVLVFGGILVWSTGVCVKVGRRPGLEGIYF